MSKATTFDVLASTYDEDFVESLIGQAQRRTSYKWLRSLLTVNSGLQVLEINCGTGTDAFWLAGLGHTVTATDASTEMIKQAQQKEAIAYFNVQPEFQTCAFDALHTTFHGRQFDCIVSNFAGLNCVSPEAMKILSQHLNELIRPGGYLAVVVFGKYCLWETLYYLLKLQPAAAFRRWSNKEILVSLSAGVQQPVYYYSAKTIARMLAPLQLIEKKPVGLCIPPSWLEGYMQQHRRFFQTLKQWEATIGGVSLFTGLADHSYLLFKKDMS